MLIKRRLHVVWFAVMLCGCAESVAPAPSYAELVVTYNAELETLDRLEAKREQLVAEIAAAARNDSGEAIGSLDDLLQKAKSLKEGANSDLPTDPEALFDHLADGSGEAQELAGQLIDGLLGSDSKSAKPEPTPEEVAAAKARQAAFQAELTTLDVELAKQKERVERARSARDAADSPGN